MRPLREKSLRLLQGHGRKEMDPLVSTGSEVPDLRNWILRGDLEDIGSCIWNPRLSPCINPSISTF